MSLTKMVRDSSASVERMEASEEDLEERMVVKMRREVESSV